MLENLDERVISQGAYAYVKRNRTSVIGTVIKETHIAHSRPISIFMAGSPGAGKTEFSQSLIASFGLRGHPDIVRIDPDDIRTLLPGYDGKNAHLFGRATSYIENKLMDYALEKQFDFLLDSTFSREAIAVQNVGRSLSRKRSVQVFFMYQEPSVAWEITKIREAKDGRRISKNVFIDRFLGAGHAVNSVKLKFGNAVALTFVQRNLLSGKQGAIAVSENVPAVDRKLLRLYSRDELEIILR